MAKQIDMNTYKLIRRLFTVEGVSQRQIAMQLGISRPTVKKYCEGYAIPGIKEEGKQQKSELRLTLEKEIIQLFEDNKDAPRKQKLNAKLIWLSLKEKGYPVGESTIRKYIQEMRIEMPEVFIPLSFEPGEAMEFDWGDIYAYIKNVKTSISVFCAVLPYSYGIFAAVFPNKKYISFFTGHVMAFEFFQGVARRSIYDNLKTAVLKDFGEKAVKQERFKTLEAHYAFEGIFCNADSGWEKGAVENLVSIIREIAFTPMPRVDNYEELQTHVTSKCIEYNMNHKIKNRTRSIRDMLEEEKKYLLPLPAYPFEPADELKVRVHSDLTVRIEGLRYSVPSKYVGLDVTAKITPFKINIYYQGKHIYSHKKGVNLSEHQYVLEHYLEIIERKPRFAHNAVPIKSGIMPEEATLFLKRCPKLNKSMQLVNVLLLGKKVDSDSLMWAISQANSTGNPTYDLVCFYLDILSSKDNAKDAIVDEVEINTVDLTKYDKLISAEGDEYE